jgi:hypothetical protein
MKYNLRVTREGGSVANEQVEASSYQEARDMMLAEPDVIDATLATTGAGRVAGSNGGMDGAIDQYVGTEQDVKDLIGF